MADVITATERRRWWAAVKVGDGQHVRERQMLRESVLFLAVGLLLAMLLQSLLVRGLRQFDKGNVGITNRVMAGGIDADVLISGSSRAMYHYDPRVIESGTKLKAFNVGRDGTKLHEQLHLLQVYLQKNKKPSYVIQNLDAFSLRENADVTDPQQYIGWLDHEEIYRPLVDTRLYFFVFRLFPIIGITYTGGGPAAVRGLLGERDPEEDERKGFAPQYRVWNEDFERIRRLNPKGLSWQNDPRKRRTLEELLQLCRANGIQAVLVYSPEFRDTQTFFLSRNETMRVYAEVAKEFHVPLWDYSNVGLAANKEYFYNSQHMNQRGAAAFSKLVADRLVREMRGL